MQRQGEEGGKVEWSRGGSERGMSAAQEVSLRRQCGTVRRWSLTASTWQRRVEALERGVGVGVTASEKSLRR